ncbi:MAG: Outer membrane autotransporter [Parcubacteria group bacterium GW2011_GWC2_45_15]|nr:MAG: Outer membrane autotransporter [Parcubacteria group bacterium GW2011_GWC2_45_15]
MKKILLISVLSLCAMTVVVGYAAAATTISTSINTGGTLTVGADAAGTDVLFYTDVSGEELLWDASENMLTIDGANGANALQVTDGNVAFSDDLAVTANTTVGGTLGVTGITTLTGNLNINGYATTTAASGNFATEGTLTVVGATTMTGNFYVNGYATTTASTGAIATEGALTADGTVTLATTTVNGFFTLNGVRDAGTGYDNFMTVSGDITGTVGGAKTRGVLVDLTRPATADSTEGDIEDTGIMVRVKTLSDSTTAGNKLTGLDVESKADNPDGTITNVQGAAITAKSDTSAGSVASMWGLLVNVQNNAAVTTDLISGDFRMFRQAATEPTNEFVLRVRNENTSGTGVDAGVRIYSNGSNGVASAAFDYAIDMSSSTINTADIRLANGALIANGDTDTLTVTEAVSSFVGAITVTGDVTVNGYATTTAATGAFAAQGSGAFGTTTPTSKLDIFSTGTSTMIIDSSTKGGCLCLKDLDSAGYTCIAANDGVISYDTYATEALAAACGD